jgi:hypothetical protein
MSNSRTRYPGAQPFSDDEVSRKTFFGRKGESTELANKILANRLVVVYAVSGLGKTSLLNAGVAELLRNEKALPLIVRVNDTQRGPFISILEGIHAATERQMVEYAAGSQASLWHFFKTAEFWQGDLLITPVLILDQFEELFTLQSAEVRAAFLSDLGFLVRGVPPSTSPQRDVGTTKNGDLHQALTDTPPALRLVLSLREDYLGCLEDAADWIPQILDHRFRLAPLSIEAGKEALTAPAEIDDNLLQTKPFKYAPEAVTTIIAHLTRRSCRPTTVKQSKAGGGWKRLFRRSSQLTTYAVRYVEPFQLQLICQRIERMVAARQQRTSSALTVTMQDIGGEEALRRTLQDFYKQEIHALSSRRQRRAVRRLCEKYLISPQGRRLSIDGNEIRRQLKLSGEVLTKLVDRRLLRSDLRADSAYYELSHDTLIEPVLSTGRVKGRLLGLLAACAGALVLVPTAFVLLMGLWMLYVHLAIVFGMPVSEAFQQKHEPNQYLVMGISFLLFYVPAFAFLGISLCVRGIQTFRRYRSRA